MILGVKSKSNQITTEFHVYCSRYEELPFVNQRRIPLNKGCQSVYSAGYFEQRHPRRSTNPTQENPGLFYDTRDWKKASNVQILSRLLPTVGGQLTVWREKSHEEDNEGHQSSTRDIPPNKGKVSQR